MGIIIPSAEGPGKPFSFGHELVRQTLLASISVPRQERLHVGVADAIERLYPTASTSVPETSRTISSKPVHSLTTGDWSIISRSQERQHFGLLHLRKPDVVLVAPCRIWLMST